MVHRVTHCKACGAEIDNDGKHQCPESESCTWEKVDGRYVCMAKHCPHWLEGGACAIGKVSLSCDNEECKWNKGHRCRCMDVHLDAAGRCLGMVSR